MSHNTHRNVMNQPKYGQIIKLGLNNTECLSVFPVPLTNYDTDEIWHCWQIKMAGIFTKRIWQP